ncbi:MAG: HlyD family efflux transporter periplasmic adaptor subunit [Eubacteriales bacterium]|nr:HlyD family efflux transporter periplasmic adaptor subunit [Eubacteriales bacterium]
MKKLFSLFLCAALLCSAGALAVTEEELAKYAVANGQIGAVEFIDLTAPCSGVLESFDVAVGDEAAAGEALFSMLTTKVYAPEDGILTWVFAQEGERAEEVMARYGALASIEPVQAQRIMASTQQAYDDEDNRTVHVGELLYFKSSRSGKEKGVGRVISVSGTNYAVDILSGEFETGESLTLYRSKDYSSKDSVGRGSVVRRDPLSVSGSGVVAQVAVESGEAVQAGDLLLTLMGPDADRGASPVVRASIAGVVAAVPVSAGQQVWKGQLLARIYPEEQKEVVVQVDEVYLDNIKLGDKLPVTLDTDEEAIFTGVVTEISAMGSKSANAAYYTVHLSLSDAGELMLGQSAKVYLPK